MSEYAAKWDPEVAKKFQQLDANSDGFISANEALQGATHPHRGGSWPLWRKDRSHG